MLPYHQIKPRHTAKSSFFRWSVFLPVFTTCGQLLFLFFNQSFRTHYFLGTRIFPCTTSRSAWLSPCWILLNISEQSPRLLQPHRHGAIPRLALAAIRVTLCIAHDILFHFEITSPLLNSCDALGGSYLLLMNPHFFGGSLFPSMNCQAILLDCQADLLEVQASVDVCAISAVCSPFFINCRSIILDH